MSDLIISISKLHIINKILDILKLLKVHERRKEGKVIQIRIRITIDSTVTLLLVAVRYR